MSDATGMEDILREIDNVRQQLREHQIYHQLGDIGTVQAFMEHHVFAVWDFMSLVKTLQCRLTRGTLPWVPEGSPMMRRYINQIVLDEEADDFGRLGCLSHFELFRKAMAEAGADAGPIDRFIELLRVGEEIEAALEDAEAPMAARAFITNTLRITKAGKLHAAAASLALARTEPIPGLFRKLIANLNLRFPGRLRSLALYLDRHVALDEKAHAPMAAYMLAELCGNNRYYWQDACKAALGTLNARLALWDAVVHHRSLADRRAPLVHAGVSAAE
jgi:hypothetical protein